ncbi:alcohol dehydrogenase family protein [Roseobacter weihaiensis]|uniref:alcohol dehydrogenase family protein n=1 Tax=Roseobacter weihaiensis TaxID=2763262 RepID=UPI001D0AC286|nr:alcohol dehydrogenase family protein [Roseobacter sp. H9]
MLPSRMKAVPLTGHGGLEKLVYRTNVPVPEPLPHEVLIHVRAAAVNNTDINTRTGWYSKSVRGGTASAAVESSDGAADADGAWSGALDFPRIQGTDCCGEIVAVGEDIDAARIGDRVLVRPIHLPAGAKDTDALITFGSERDGAFAKYTTVDSAHAVRIESSLSDVELASFPCAFSTAEGMIQRAALRAERVLITGASGGVGSAAVQLAKRRGAQVTAITTAEKADALIALGADVTLERDDKYPAGGFDVVLDLVGGPRWPDLLDALKVGGRYITSGAIAGPIVELDLRTLYLNDLTLIGSTRQDASVFDDLVGYIEAGDLKPVIAETFTLKELRKAQEMFLTKTHLGKICITVGSQPARL